MTITALALLASTTMAAQVSLRFNPEPMEVMDTLRAKHFAKWTVDIKNEGPLPRRVSLQDVNAKAGSLKLIGPNEARLMLTRRQRLTAPAVIVRTVEYLDIGATAATASELVKTDKKITAWLALGVPVAHLFGDKLRGEIPDIGPLIADLFEKEVLLGAGESVTKGFFAGLVKGAAPFTARIE